MSPVRDLPSGRCRDGVDRGSQPATPVLVLGLVAGEYLLVLYGTSSRSPSRVASIVEGTLYLLVAGIIVAAAAACDARSDIRSPKLRRPRERAETRESRVRLRDFAAYCKPPRRGTRPHPSELHDDLGRY